MRIADDLMTRWPALAIAARRDRLQDSFQLTTGCLSAAVPALDSAAARAATGLWNRDPSVWSQDAAVQSKVADRLGWLDSPALMADSLERLVAFAEAVKGDGFTDAVLLGMGGSSLAPEVLRSVLGITPGWLRLHMLDSTDPAAVLAVETPLEHTLFIFASKSGTTIEPNSLAAFFRHALESRGIENWAGHFVGITDEGTELARLARSAHFRDLFINPSDIGGRYSALSFFGLVPAALMGQDITGLVAWGLAMLASVDPGSVAADRHGALALGVALAAGARNEHDKLTLLAPPALVPFGLWIEQLVAESTGKNGVGVVPIVGETPGQSDAYGDDRLFVNMRIAGAADGSIEALATELKHLNAAVADIAVPEPSAIGAEFVRWEVATAIAGALLGINPFDEPNVSQAKEATRVLLAEFRTEGRLPVPAPDRTTGAGVTLTLSRAARDGLDGTEPDALLTLLRQGDYLALLAYLGPDPHLAAALHALRMAIRSQTRVATMFGYGPRYLHSTGQLHKGGPNTGVFVLISAQPQVDLPIPGEAFSFGTLERAQAIGDFQSLDATGRRALHVHLPAPERGALASIADALLSHLTGTIG